MARLVWAWMAGAVAIAAVPLVWGQSTPLKGTPCLDGHVHLTNITTIQYTWQQQLPQLNKTWTVGNLVDASILSPLQPTEVVFIEVSAVEADWVNEMHYIQALADAQRPGEPVIKAIVGHVALQAGSTVGPLLDRLQKEVPLFRGVRQGESSSFFTNDSFVQGICELGARNLEFDVLANPSLFSQVAELARRCPQTRLVLDHMGGPAIYNGSAGYAIWSAAIQQLALQPNIYVKVSGAPSEAAHGSVGNWTVDEIEPFVRHSIELFGWERAFFAGNWFFLRLGGTYESWGNAVATILDRMKATEAQKQMFFFSTAQSAYNIET